MGELILRDRDYVPDGMGGFSAVQGREALLERVLFKLAARRGGFALLPEVGSELYLLPACKPSQRENYAQVCVTQALADERELVVTDVTLDQEQDGHGRLWVYLKYQDEPLSVWVEV